MVNQSIDNHSASSRPRTISYADPIGKSVYTGESPDSLEAKVYSGASHGPDGQITP